MSFLAFHIRTPPANVEAQVQALVQALALPQLEALGEALLDFAGLDDLIGWLQGQSLCRISRFLDVKLDKQKEKVS